MERVLIFYLSAFKLEKVKIFRTKRFVCVIPRFRYNLSILKEHTKSTMKLYLFPLNQVEMKFQE